MQKLKNKKSITKRFKLTAKGKIKRSKAFTGHLKESKNRKRKRNLKRSDLVSSSEEAMIKKLMPYG